jgi:excisionase family DNA binding protein
MDEPLLTIKDLAALLQRSKASIYQMITRGQIPRHCVIKLGPKSVRFRREAIDQWLDSLS